MGNNLSLWLPTPLSHPRRQLGEIGVSQSFPPTPNLERWPILAPAKQLNNSGSAMEETGHSLVQFPGAPSSNNCPHLTHLCPPTHLPAKPSLRQPQDPALSVLGSLTSTKVAGLHTSPGTVCSASEGSESGRCSSRTQTWPQRDGNQERRPTHP